MTEYTYEIEMQTLIGVKYGTMYAEVSDKEVKGFLHLMKQSTSFCGRIEENGDCIIKGEIISLTKTIPYQAAGRMTKGAVLLDMYTNQGHFHITGKETHHEEIL